MMFLPHPVFWIRAPKAPPEQLLTENNPHYGKVYHAASVADVMEMLRREQSLVWQAHPRTKSSAEMASTLTRGGRVGLVARLQCY